MRFKADGVVGIAGCCVAVAVDFVFDQPLPLGTEIASLALKGHIQIQAKETLTYYDMPRRYAEGVALERATLIFEPIPLALTTGEKNLHETLIEYLYTYLEGKNALGYNKYQVLCQDPSGEAVSLNIDLAKSFVFFDLD